MHDRTAGRCIIVYFPDARSVAGGFTAVYPGFGMGTPLLLASILGARILPKAGHWMNQIKVLFAFIMLALALYFIRPLISEAALQWLS